MLAVLDDAIAAAPRGRRAIALELHTRPGGKFVLDGELVATGKYLGQDDRGPVYGFTRRQCEAIQAAINASVRAMLNAPASDDPPYGVDYTGDVD